VPSGKTSQIFTDSEAATEYARRVQRDPKVVAKWPKFAAGKPITVVLKTMERGHLGATDKNTHTISLADNGGGNDYYTLLHEIAHLVAAYEKPGYATSPDGHGATFAGTFLTLLRLVRGDEDAAKLETTMKANNVQWEIV